MAYGDFIKNTNKDFIIHNFLTCFGLGRSPYAPKLLGSLFGLLIVYLLSFFNWPIYFLFTILFCTLSLLLVGYYLESSKLEDTRELVVDQAVGILVAFMLVPITGITLILGFLFFWIFASLRPLVLSSFDQKIPKATGAMADDIFVGLIVNLIFHFLLLPMGIISWIETFLII